MNKHIILFILLLLFGIHIAYANDDLGLGDYARDINTPASASAVNIHDAWAENMAYRISHGKADGIVVDGEKETDKYISDGLGNVIIKDGVTTGPIINRTDLSNITVVIKTNKRSRF